MFGACFYCGSSAFEACAHREQLMQRPQPYEPTDKRLARFNFNGSAHILAARRDHARRIASEQTHAPDEMGEAEAAAYLGLRPCTLERYRYLQSGPDWFKEGSTIRYRREDLDRWRTATRQRRA